jgi:CPA1 family monovalent cation:H+ antiporter
MGLACVASIVLLRRRGFENTVVHVLYEVFTPFVVFLAAEALHVSGILAVVAAGLVMANSKLSLVSRASLC